MKSKIIRIVIDIAIVCVILFGYHKLIIEDRFDVTGQKYRNEIRKVFNYVQRKEDSFQVLIEVTIYLFDHNS